MEGRKERRKGGKEEGRERENIIRTCSSSLRNY
jgi:hypothetical protein